MLRIWHSCKYAWMSVQGGDHRESSDLRFRASDWRDSSCSRCFTCHGFMWEWHRESYCRKKKNSHMTWQFARRHVKSVRRFCSLRGKFGFLSIINTLRHPQSESWWCQHHTVGGLLRSGKIFKGEINADRLWRRFTDKNFKKKHNANAPESIYISIQTRTCGWILNNLFTQSPCKNNRVGTWETVYFLFVIHLNHRFHFDIKESFSNGTLNSLWLNHCKTNIPLKQTR